MKQILFKHFLLVCVSRFFALSLFSLYCASIIIACTNSKQNVVSLMKASADIQTNSRKAGTVETSNSNRMSIKKIQKTEEEWKAILTKEQYYICRLRGTERPFTSKYNKHEKKGTYTCVACGIDLFFSQSKYDSQSGWPSFYEPAVPENVEKIVDNSLGMVRTEVVCAKCDSHLGHVFPDGPQPTGLRYCINSIALKFVEK